jgi:hypothetical protein
MGLFSSLLGGDEWRDKPAEEKAADINRYKALRKANEESSKVIREECPTYYQMQEAIIDAEADVPWWRR